MLRVYRGLLHLYPPAYRREFMEEMLWVFGEAQKDLVGLPVTTRVAFHAREIVGLLAGAGREHRDKIFGIQNFGSLRGKDMRPEFRFPRSTVWLMALSLVGVLLAIEKAKSIQLKFAAGAHIVAVWSTLPEFATTALALVCIAGAAGWALLFALGRSGLHRLAELPTGIEPETKSTN